MEKFMKGSTTLILCALAVSAHGCVSEDERLVQLSKQSVDRQAEQNTQIAKQSQHVAEATKSLVKADAEARKELIVAQNTFEQHIQAERSHLNQQFNQLEAERQTLAKARHRAPIIAGAIQSAGILIACMVPLILVMYLIWTINRSQGSEALGDFLVDDLLAPSPVLLKPLRSDGLLSEANTVTLLRDDSK
jgi:hypothetical protein